MKLNTANKLLLVPVATAYVVLCVTQVKPFFAPRTGGEDLTGFTLLTLPFAGGILFTFCFMVIEFVCALLERIRHKKVRSDIKFSILALTFTALSIPLFLYEWPYIRADMR